MRRIFGLGTPLVETLSAIGDVICASALWILFSLPVVTMGAANVALYRTINRCMRQNKPGIWKTFSQTFRDNFKTATVAWLIELAAVAVLTLDTLVFRGMWMKGDSLGFLYWLAIAFLVAALAWTAYVAAYAARFTGGVRDVLHFGLLMLRMHPLYALGMMLLILGGLVLCLLAPALVLFAPAGMCWGSTYLLEPVFRMHMRAEDLEKETGGLPRKE